MKSWTLSILFLPACAESLIPEAGPPSLEQADATNGQPTPPNPAPEDQPPVKAMFEVNPDQAVTLSGRVSYTGSESAPILLQILREAEGEPVRLLHGEQLSAPGPFTIQAPPNLGAVSAVAILDIDENGRPTPTDLGGRFDLEIAEAPVENIAIVIGSIDSLGTLVPGSMLPGTGTMESTDGEPPAPPEKPPLASPEPIVSSPEHAPIGDISPPPAAGSTEASGANHPPMGGVAPPPTEGPLGAASPNEPSSLPNPAQPPSTPSTEQ